MEEIKSQEQQPGRSEEQRREKVRVIPIQYIDDFPDHPFQVREDEEMNHLVESIKEYGVLTPVVARRTEAGIDEKTERLGPAVAAVYGWDLPDPLPEHKKEAYMR